MSVLIVGSIALDTVKTPVEEHADLMGGSATYAALGASFFSPVRLVGIVGDDFPAAEFDFWKSRKIDAEGVQRVPGKTFRWWGEYMWDMNTRETRSVGVLESEWVGDVAAAAQCRQRGQAMVSQPPQHEKEQPGRRAIDPLDVVDRNEDRVGLGDDAKACQ